MTDAPVPLDEQIAAVKRVTEMMGPAFRDDDFAMMRSILVTLEAQPRQPGEGYNEPCYYCGEPCNAVAGNPGMWPVALCHPDDPGVVKYHHHDCVAERLEAQPALLAVVDAARKALAPFAEIGQWLFAIDKPDDEVFVPFKGLNGYDPNLTRGDFKRAFDALAALSPGAGQGVTP
jgi:hypothetical protein